MAGPTDIPTAYWKAAADAMLSRMETTAATLRSGFPHWADSATGEWTTTSNGDWTGGAFPGILWLGYRMTAEQRICELARAWCLKLRPRAKLETAFKGFGFYYGAALGQVLANDQTAATIALEAAESLLQQFDPILDLIPLGRDAEEADGIGKAFSSIDSLQAAPLLFWAARQTGDDRYRTCALHHVGRVLDIHCRGDGSIIQSSELDAKTATVRRTFTHKGVSDTSIWGRAQAWGMLYAAMAYAQCLEETRWLRQSMAAADWWLAHIPHGMVAFWDFDDPAIPNTVCDTAATAIVCAALLRLAVLARDAQNRRRYRDAAQRTAHALISNHLTRTDAHDPRPAGMLVGGCFNKRSDARPRDQVSNAELIFGSYYLRSSRNSVGKFEGSIGLKGAWMLGSGAIERGGKLA